MMGTSFEPSRRDGSNDGQNIYLNGEEELSQELSLDKQPLSIQLGNPLQNLFMIL